jgi:hypothetical protein
MNANPPQQQDKRERRKNKQQLRKNKQKVIKICNDGAFKHDCIQLILNNSTFSDEHLYNIALVSKLWNKTIFNIYDKIKKIEFTIMLVPNHEYVIYCFAPHTHDMEPYYPPTNNIISIWSQLTFTNKKLPNNELYVQCIGCGELFEIYPLKSSTNCTLCETYNTIPRKNINKTAYQLWVFSSTSNLK